MLFFYNRSWLCLTNGMCPINSAVAQKSAQSQPCQPSRDWIFLHGLQWPVAHAHERPLTVPFTLLALFLPSSRLKLLFAVMAIVCVAVSSFALWVAEHRARIAAESEISKKAEKELHYSSEWKELSARFEKLPRHVSGWQCQRKNNETIHETWDFSGGADAQVKTLCGYAGRLLMKSPAVLSELSENVTKQINPVWMWLVFLKEHAHSFKHDGQLQSGEKGDVTLYFMGSIHNIGDVSATVCLDCAAVEL